MAEEKDLTQGDLTKTLLLFALPYNACKKFAPI